MVQVTVPSVTVEPTVVPQVGSVVPEVPGVVAMYKKLV